MGLNIQDLIGGSIVDGVAKIVQLFKVDPTVALQKQTEIQEIQLKMQSDAAAAITAQLKAQTDIDLAEAQSPKTFISGWRPFLGWVCGAAFAYAFILQPFVLFILAVCHANVDPKLIPTLDIATMSPILLGMLGLGTMRTFEKVNGVQNTHQQD